jgi:hypothetical protein
MNQSPCYFLHSDAEKFLIDKVLPNDGKRHPVQISMLLGSVLNGEAAFLMACQVLHHSTPKTRDLIEVLLQKHTRNIKLGNDRIGKHLVNANKKYIKEIGLDMSSLRILPEIMAVAMAPIKNALGIPIKDPADHFYLIDTVVLGATHNTDLRRYLERKSVLGPVSPQAFDEITAEIFERWSDEYESVFNSLKETKTREVISLIDLSDVEGQRIVMIVNGDSELLQFEDWRLPLLIEQHDREIMLGEFPKFNEKKDGHYLKYNELESGKVVGRYDAKNSCLHVACFSTKKPPLVKRSTFILDQDFLMCLYVVIKGLREGQEEYQRLLQQALVATGDHPFTTYFQ